MRAEINGIEEEAPGSAKHEKVNKICDSLKDQLVGLNQDNKYLLPILTTYIKKQPQELKQVLKLIQNMQRKEEEENKLRRIVPPHLNPETMRKDIDPKSLKLGSHEALEYVSWLVKPDRLFDVALTTYDFDLVTLVATQTQKDPTEYVPYLQELNAMDPVLMKFKVNLDLKVHDKAVKKLAKGDRALNGASPELSEQYFTEALTVIKKNRLFKQALEYYAHSEDLTKRLKLAFGEYLEARGYSEEAGFLYAAASHSDLALNAFKKSLNVEMVLSLLVGMPEEQASTIREELVERLKNASRYEQAADLIMQRGDKT